MPRYTAAGEGIYAIDTEYVRPLMDASHLIVDNGRAAYVDTGTTLSVPNLLASLEDVGLTTADVDAVFLTHIHLDHAGGAGALMQHLPNARAYIHPRGAPHMHEPEKLIAGTIAVYGEKMYHAMYGEIIPIEKHRIVTVSDGMRVIVGSREFELIHTPGHALHHYCMVDQEARLVFTGDTFGVSYRETDTGNGAFIIPTTTPVHFDPDAAHASIDRIMGYAPHSAYLTHYSRVTDLPRLARDLHDGLDNYVRICRECADQEDRVSLIYTRLTEYIYGRLDDHGYDGDRDAKDSILNGDITLNAQGLEVWLKRQEKHATQNA
jgi:glyoxylase-like metal-dependent hydrolase (beta-lactamase superfamily II)